MKRTFSAIARSITPTGVWDAYLRLRGLEHSRPWRRFRKMATCTNTKPLFEITHTYADNIELYEPFLKRIGVSPFWLPSGQGVIIKK